MNEREIGKSKQDNRSEELDFLILILILLCWPTMVMLLYYVGNITGNFTDDKMIHIFFIEITRGNFTKIFYSVVSLGILRILLKETVFRYHRNAKETSFGTKKKMNSSRFESIFDE